MDNLWHSVSNNLQSMSVNLQTLRRSHNFLVVMSGCDYTRSSFINFINSKMDVYNRMLKQKCEEFKFLIVNNLYTISMDIKDFVRLNPQGETLMLENLMIFL